MPHPGVIHIPCRKCGGQREHFGTGVCWDCMTLPERLRFAGDDACRCSHPFAPDHQTPGAECSVGGCACPTYRRRAAHHEPPLGARCN